MIAKEPKAVAKLTKWNGKEEWWTIKKAWIEDIVFAIKGQFYVTDLKSQLEIHGENYSNVDIYEVQ